MAEQNSKGSIGKIDARGTGQDKSEIRTAHENGWSFEESRKDPEVFRDEPKHLVRSAKLVCAAVQCHGKDTSNASQKVRRHRYNEEHAGSLCVSQCRCARITGPGGIILTHLLVRMYPRIRPE
jgi:hypothetical protein